MIFHLVIALTCSLVVMNASLQLRSESSIPDARSTRNSNIFEKIRELAGIKTVVVEKANTPGAAMAQTLMTQFHLQGMSASSAVAKQVVPFRSHDDASLAAPEAPPEIAPTSYLKKKLYVARNSCAKSSTTFTYAESVGIGICYPMYANLTAFNVFSVSGNVVTVNTYASASCSGTPISTSTEKTGCDDNGFYTLSVSSSQGWGSAVGFGANVYSTKSNCKNHSGAVTGSVIISTSPTGCYNSVNGTSDGVSCSGS
jgi:hypothetical protein